MLSDSSKQYIKDQLPVLMRQLGLPEKKNFSCINPDHTDRKPSMAYDRKHQQLHCFGCGAKYDTFDVLRIMYGWNGKELFRQAAEMFGVEKDTIAYRPKMSPQIGKKTVPDVPQLSEKDIVLDLTDPLQAAHDALMDPNNVQAQPVLQYLHSRGFTDDDIRRFKIGYVPSCNAPLAAYPQFQNRSPKAHLYNITLPYQRADGSCYYFVSEICDRNQVDQWNGKYRKINNVPGSAYNEFYLTGTEVPENIFVVEGIYDAMSVEACGGHAIACVGTAYARIVEICKQYHPDTTLIISLDNDDAGEKAASKMSEELDLIGIRNYVAHVAVGKDANEDFAKNRDVFQQRVRDVVIGVQEKLDQIKKQELEGYYATSAGGCLQAFVDHISDSMTSPCYSTGIPSLDTVLDGGLYNGLYILGAISSLGKTSLCLQTMDYIASQGNDVLIFSLEMSRYELMAKSVSRHTYNYAFTNFADWRLAKTTRDILQGSRYANYTTNECDVIQHAIIDYQQYAGHIFIHEGIGDIGVSQIYEAVKNHIALTGVRPVVLIDYLQILAAYDVHMTDKQNTDKAVLELKRMSRDLQIPVVGISSFNRENYLSPVNLSAFKESGAIEYGSDTVIGCQYEGMDYQPKDGAGKMENETEHKARVNQLLDNIAEMGRLGQPLPVQIKILKQRNGAKGSAVVDFMPKFNYFIDRPANSSKRQNNGGVYISNGSIKF